MSWKRNTAGLEQAAQNKRLEAFAKVESGIKQLLREEKPVTFEAVAEVAGVSRSWLYKQPELKERIAHLRTQKRLPHPSPATDLAASKESIIITLRQQIKELRQEKAGLQQQIEVAYSLAWGQISPENSDDNQHLLREVNHLQTMLAQSVAEHQALRQSHQQLQAAHQELKAQLLAIAGLEVEIAELRKHNQRLLNKVMQFESAGRIRPAPRLSTRGKQEQFQPEIPEIEF